MRSAFRRLALWALAWPRGALPATASAPEGEAACPAGGAGCPGRSSGQLGILSELEGEEGPAGASQKVHLVQVRASASRGRPSRAPAAQGAREGAAGGGGAVTLDHNGRMCMMCGAPLPERVGSQRFRAFRRDCGNRSTPTGPELAALSEPAARLAPPGQPPGGLPSNGFCELNYAKSCADAIANEDYLYWAKSLDFTHPDLRETAGWDGRYCRVSGFLEPDVVALQHNFSGLQAKARELCSTKYARRGAEGLSFLDMMSRARHEDGAPSAEEADVRAAWSCAMGDLGCDLAMCAYSFCARAGAPGSAGLYGDCPGWHPERGMPPPAPAG